MSDSDDDAPPLEAMADQLKALKVGAGVEATPYSSTASADDAEALPVAQIVLPPEPETQKKKKQAAKPAIKKGFFDAKPKAKSRKPKQESSQEEIEEIPVLHAKKSSGNGKHIPEFFHLDPSEEEKKLNEMKDGLLSALKPTEDMMSDVMQKPELLNGFDDPEVMAAVGEIAKDPMAMKKYANNPKVRKFYEAMGMFVGNQLEKKGEETTK